MHFLHWPLCLLRGKHSHIFHQHMSINIYVFFLSDVNSSDMLIMNINEVLDQFLSELRPSMVISCEPCTPHTVAPFPWAQLG